MVDKRSLMEASHDDSGSRRERDANSETGSDLKPPPTKKRKKSSQEESSSTLQERWDEMFERLRRYKETKGNCNVPNR